MSEGNSAWRLGMVRGALLVVAASAEEQVAWVRRHRVGPDEIALTFDDAWRAPRGALAAETLAGLRAIDAVFEEMSADCAVDRWSEVALAEDEGWCRARMLAREILDREGVALGPLPEIRVIR
ncbi:hypothetical protein ACIPPM_12210 [Streptomyces sp. NPDC090119]|uniref:hypothetical protein n=1 Tax=Streptomyces sp. NPDC090119 TaxID=3365951 RepID=UPI00382452CC